MSTVVRGALLGEGTYGSVFEGTLAETGQRVAVKRIKPHELVDMR
jgi:serine/threonine protein kinase